VSQKEYCFKLVYNGQLNTQGDTDFSIYSNISGCSSTNCSSQNGTQLRADESRLQSFGKMKTINYEKNSALTHQTFYQINSKET